MFSQTLLQIPYSFPTRSTVTLASYDEKRVAIAFRVDYVQSGPGLGTLNPFQNNYLIDLNLTDHGDMVKQQWMFIQAQFGIQNVVFIATANGGPVPIGWASQWAPGIPLFASPSNVVSYLVTTFTSSDKKTLNESQDDECNTVLNQITGEITTVCGKNAKKKKPDPALYLQTAAMLRDARKDNCRCPNRLMNIDEAIRALQKCGA